MLAGTYEGIVASKLEASRKATEPRTEQEESDIHGLEDALLEVKKGEFQQKAKEVLQSLSAEDQVQSLVANRTLLFLSSRERLRHLKGISDETIQSAEVRMLRKLDGFDREYFLSTLSPEARQLLLWRAQAHALKNVFNRELAQSLATWQTVTLAERQLTAMSLKARQHLLHGPVAFAFSLWQCASTEVLQFMSVLAFLILVVAG